MKNAKCPVCDRDLTTRIPDLCPTCGWDCWNDITLSLSLHKYSEKERGDYFIRLTKAQQLWQEKKDEKDTLRKAEEEKKRIQKEIAAKCSALKTHISVLTIDKQWAEAIRLLDEYDKLKTSDKWAVDQRRKIQELQDKEKREFEETCSALRASINSSILKQQLQEALKFLDEYDRLIIGDSWSTEQRKLIQDRMSIKPTPRPVPVPLPTPSPPPSNQDRVPHKKGSAHLWIYFVVAVVVIAAIVGFYNFRKTQLGVPVYRLSEVSEPAAETDTTLTPKHSASNVNPSINTLSFLDDFDDNRNNWNLKSYVDSYAIIQNGILKIVNNSSSRFVITKKTDFNFDNNWKLSFRIHNVNASHSFENDNVIGFAGNHKENGEGDEYRIRMFGWHLNPLGEPTQSPFTIIDNTLDEANRVVAWPYSEEYWDLYEIIKHDNLITCTFNGEQQQFYFPETTYYVFKGSFGNTISISVNPGLSLELDFVKIELSRSSK